MGNEPLKIKPHHIETLEMFVRAGPGLYYKSERKYGERWVHNVCHLSLKIKNDPELKVKIVDDLDEICNPCPYIYDCLQDKTSHTIPKTSKELDEKAIKKYKIRVGNVYRLRDLLSLR
jgi:hypothetical protein